MVSGSNRTAKANNMENPRIAASIQSRKKPLAIRGQFAKFFKFACSLESTKNEKLLHELTYEEAKEKYKDFLFSHEDKANKQFDEMNNFQTSVRGFKSRGNFDTLPEARNRAKKLYNEQRTRSMIDVLVTLETVHKLCNDLCEFVPGRIIKNETNKKCKK